ncbi:MAG: oxygen-binding di-iron domain-containing protein [Acidimicrobiia bacterium]
METTTTEIADGIHRISTFFPDVGMPFNQYLVVADEPLLFHTGHRQLFPLVSAAVGRIMPIESLRWITFGHVEADECGSMNQWLDAAPAAQVAHGMTAVMVSLNDLADRPPRALIDGEVIDLGGKRVRWIDTPHVPHGWEAGLLYEETTGTLFAGDLFTALGDVPALSDRDIVEPAIAGEEMFHATALTPLTGPTIRRLAELDAATLALMHGPAFTGDSVEALQGLASHYESTLAASLEAAPV